MIYSTCVSVCGSDEREYQSDCHLNRLLCESRIDYLYKKEDGACTRDCVLTEWSQWSACDDECGEAYSER